MRPSADLHFLIVEDQTLVRQLVISDINARFPASRFIEVGSLQELKQFDQKRVAPIDLAIVDLELPDGSALEWVEAYAACETNTRVLVLSSIKEDFILFRTLRSQVAGFVHKSDTRESLIAGIEMALSGNLFFSPTVQTLKRGMSANPFFFNKILTEKEQQVLKLIGEGLSNEEIAEIEGCKVLTVVCHRQNMMNKLELHSAPELMRYALQKGFAKIRN